MSERVYGQQTQMEDPTMVGTLRAQARMIWPLEQPLLEGLGVGRAARLVDLGCGTGEFAGRVAAAWPQVQVTGLDLFDGHLARARAAHSAAACPNLDFVQGDARATGLPADHADVVTLRHLLHALPDVDRVLVEARRILRPGGLLYILAEDYAGLLFDAPSEAAQRLFLDATPALAAHGTNLLHGRAAHREMRQAGFDRVTVTPLVVDTSNTPRAVFAEMLEFWRDGYAAFIATSGGFEEADIRARFDALVATTLDPDRYACWLLLAVSGHKPAE